jgi:hypothetical protein
MAHVAGRVNEDVNAFAPNQRRQLLVAQASHVPPHASAAALKRPVTASGRATSL